MSMTDLLWKAHWVETQERFRQWWEGTGLAVCLTAVRPKPRIAMPKPVRPDTLEAMWLDPRYRGARAEYGMAHTEYLAESFPHFDTLIGPGSLGSILGADTRLAEETVWYFPSIVDPEAFGAIRFRSENNRWLDAHLALIDEGLRRSEGRYLVGMPDLIENLDTLSALRGDVPLLYDLIERPGWVTDRLAEINTAFFQVFDIIYQRIQAADGSHVFAAFNLWGPGRTAKVQCDLSANLSPLMFRQFVAPALTEQCAWLDYSMYHLDGTNAMQHLDALLEIAPLRAIEWTPQAGRPGGGSAEWYDLYRRIKAGSKSVQVVGVHDDELVPLLDAIGPQGVYVLLSDDPDRPRTLDQAERLLRAIEPYYGR
jgi:hypothetical protein